MAGQNGDGSYSAVQRQRRLTTAVLWMGLAYVAALAAQVLVNGLAGRALGTRHFGAFASAITFLIIISQLGLLGQQTTALRDASLMRDSCDRALAAKHVATMRTVSRIVLPALGLLSGVILVARVGDANLFTAFLIAAGSFMAVGVGARQRIDAAYLRGFGSIIVSSFLEGRSGGALLLMAQSAAIAAVVLLDPAPSLGWVLFAYGLAVVPSAVLSRALLKPHFHDVEVKWRPMKELRSLMSSHRAFAALQAGILMDINIDILIAAAVLGPTDSSLFASAQRVAMIVVIPTALAQMALGPTFARSATNPKEAETIVRTAATVTGALAILALIPLVFLSAEFLRSIYGAGFGEGRNILVLLSLGYCARVMAGLATAWMSMTGLERSAVKIYWAGLGGRIILGSTFGSLWGLYGLTILSVVITILVFWGLWYSVRKKTGLRTHPTLHPRLDLLHELRS